MTATEAILNRHFIFVDDSNADRFTDNRLHLYRRARERAGLLINSVNARPLPLCFRAGSGAMRQLWAVRRCRSLSVALGEPRHAEFRPSRRRVGRAPAGM